MGQVASCFQHVDEDHFTLAEVEQSAYEEMTFPMWVIAVKDFLELPAPAPGHFDLVREGKLVKWKPGMFVIFASHQWLSFGHPDPNGDQTTVLQAALKNILSGKVRVTTGVETEMGMRIRKTMTEDTVENIRDGYIWFDWFGVPNITGNHKEDLQDVLKAVNSIPAYVEASALFMVVCPLRMHADTKEMCCLSSWKARGWCRLEVACRALSLREQFGEAIIIKSDTQIKYENPSLWIQYPVGTGNFTVESDRQILHGVLETTLEKKIRFHESLGSKGRFLYLFFKCIRETILEGLIPASEVLQKISSEESSSQECLLHALHMAVAQDSMHVTARTEPLHLLNEEKFLEEYGFKSLRDSGAHGFGPLMCATLSGNVEMIKRILEAGADIDETTGDAVPELYLFGHMTPLSLAALFGPSRSVETLLLFKADVGRRDSFGNIALHMSCRAKSLERSKLLVEAKSDIEACTDINNRPLHASIIFGDGRALPLLRYLIEQKCKVQEPDIFGSPPLHWVGLFSGSPEEARLLIENGADVNFRAVTTSVIGRIGWKLSSWALRCGYETETFRVLAETPDGTALHNAAVAGQAELIKTLLELKGDPDIRNYEGHTARDIALLQNHDEIVTIFDQASRWSVDQRETR